MNYLASSLLTALILAFISLVGVVILIIKDKILQKILLLLVSFSAGSLMGSAFFHLLPEALSEQSCVMTKTFIYLLVGFSLFFIFERFLKWRHCHESTECAVHSLGYMNLFGDGLHNIIDGLIIVASFQAGSDLGLAVALAVILHEIPQEIGDFGVLLHAGFKKSQALFYNFIIALMGFFGIFIGYFLINRVEHINEFLLPLAAGGFIYIAASDLIPELHKESNLKKSILSFVIFLLALVFMYVVKFLEM